MGLSSFVTNEDQPFTYLSLAIQTVCKVMLLVEAASSIAVKVKAGALSTADDVRLGAAIEAGTVEVIDAPAKGIGEPGMGSTASAVPARLEVP